MSRIIKIGIEVNGFKVAAEEMSGGGGGCGCGGGGGCGCGGGVVVGSLLMIFNYKF